MPEVVLDPFSVVCRLALLNYKPAGTKLEIHSNRVAFSHPEAREWVWRSAMSVFRDRTAYSRSALCNLRKPICRAVAWYGATSPLVIKNATAGLAKLLEVYEADGRDTSTEALEFCHAILLNHEDAPALLSVKEDDKRSDLLNTLREQWTADSLRSVEAWMATLDAHGDDGAIVDTVDTYLTRKEPAIRAILTQTAV